jgi:hypothetical protein
MREPEDMVEAKFRLEKLESFDPVTQDQNREEFLHRFTQNPTKICTKITAF